MKRIRTRQNTRQIHIHEETYKMLRLRAVDRDIRLLEVAEEVIRAGFEVVGNRETRPTSPVN